MFLIFLSNDIFNQVKNIDKKNFVVANNFSNFFSHQNYVMWYLGILKVVYMFVILFFAVIICLCVELHMSYFCLVQSLYHAGALYSSCMFGLLKLLFIEIEASV